MAGDEQTSRSGRALGLLLRLLCAGALAVGLVAYILGIIVGKVPPGQRVSVADLAAIAVGLAIVGLLIQPRWVSLVEALQIGQVKLQLRQLQDRQERQKQELDELRFTLSVLVSEEGRRHLQNLNTGNTANYERSYWLESELRYLRTMGLIKSKRGIREMPNHPFDLADFVELTETGREYVRRADLVLDSTR